MKQRLLATYNDLNAAVLAQDPAHLPKDLLSRLGRLKPIGDHLLTLEVLETSQEATKRMMKGKLCFLPSPSRLLPTLFLRRIGWW